MYVVFAEKQRTSEWTKFARLQSIVLQSAFLLVDGRRRRLSQVLNQSKKLSSDTRKEFVGKQNFSSTTLITFVRQSLPGWIGYWDVCVIESTKSLLLSGYFYLVPLDLFRFNLAMVFLLPNPVFVLLEDKLFFRSFFSWLFSVLRVCIFAESYLNCCMKLLLILLWCMWIPVWEEGEKGDIRDLRSALRGNEMNKKLWIIVPSSTADW